MTSLILTGDASAAVGFTKVGHADIAIDLVRRGTRGNVGTAHNTRSGFTLARLCIHRG
jgi:hypothetical protein